MSLDFRLQYEIDGNEFEVFDSNITHNLVDMAVASGVYKALWHPDKIGAVYASDITRILLAGYVTLIGSPEEYEELNDPGGWGTYEQFVPFVKNVLDACRKYPNAKIKTDV